MNKETLIRALGWIAWLAICVAIAIILMGDGSLCGSRALWRSGDRLCVGQAVKDTVFLDEPWGSVKIKDGVIRVRCYGGDPTIDEFMRWQQRVAVAVIKAKNKLEGT